MFKKKLCGVRFVITNVVTLMSFSCTIGPTAYLTMSIPPPSPNAQFSHANLHIVVQKKKKVESNLV